MLSRGKKEKEKTFSFLREIWKENFECNEETILKKEQSKVETRKVVNLQTSLTLQTLCRENL